LIDDLALAEDDAADEFAHGGETLTERVDLAGEIAGTGGAETNRRVKAFRIAQRQNSSRSSTRRRVMNAASADDRELARIEAAARAPQGKAAPQDCGYFDIRIDRDGSWFY